MQFDWVNFQQYLQTLQFQRCECMTRHRGGGIACDIRGKLTKRESCTAARLSVARQWPGTADTADANNLSKPHRDDSRGHAQVRDETTIVNVDFSAAASRKIATQHTRCVHPPRWRPPPSTVTFPRQQADKSRHNDHVLPLVRGHRPAPRLGGLGPGRRSSVRQISPALLGGVIPTRARLRDPLRGSRSGSGSRHSPLRGGGPHALRGNGIRTVGRHCTTGCRVSTL